MKNLIRKILKESDFDWVDDVVSNSYAIIYDGDLNRTDFARIQNTLYHIGLKQLSPIGAYFRDITRNIATNGNNLFIQKSSKDKVHLSYYNTFASNDYEKEKVINRIISKLEKQGYTIINYKEL